MVLDPDPWKTFWILIRQNEADPSDPGSVAPVFNGRVVLSSCVCYTILQIFWRHSHPVLTCCNDYLGKRTCLYRYCIYLWQCSASGVTTNRCLSIFSRSDLDYLTLNDALHQIKNNLCFIENVPDLFIVHSIFTVMYCTVLHCTAL